MIEGTATLMKEEREALTDVTILSRLLEKGDQVSMVVLPGDDLRFIEPHLLRMMANGLIDASTDKTRWVVTAKGIEFRNQAITALGESYTFIVFRRVHIDQMPEASWSAEEPWRAAIHIYDQRFLMPDQEDPTGRAIDMRLAAMMFQAEQHLAATKPESAPEERQVYAQRVAVRSAYLLSLVNGDFDRKYENLWMHLAVGNPFRDAEACVREAYPWRNVADSEDKAIKVMNGLYIAGRDEQFKRDHDICAPENGGCGLPLAFYETNGPVDVCPACGRTFGTPPVETSEYETVETVTYQETYVEEPVYVEEPIIVYEPMYVSAYDPYYPLATATAACIAMDLLFAPYCHHVHYGYY